jgi:GNAT superfamily N-acetyltransferase
LEANVIAAFERFSVLPGAGIAEMGGLRLLTTGIPDGFFNGVVRSAAEGGSLDTALGHFRSRGLPFHWSILPSSRPPDLVGRLRERNPTLDLALPGMTMDLRRLPERATIPPGMEVTEVSDRPQLEAWVRLGCRAFQMAEAAMPGILAMEEAFGMGSERWARRFLGFLEGRPVACSLLLLSAGVAGIYWVATLSEARGRGLGRLMTEYPLMQAREAGYRVAVLQASQMGLSVYRSIGFEDCCLTRLMMWTR